MTDTPSENLVEIEPTRSAELAESGEAILLDVRRPHEWDAGRIPGALHIDMNELAAVADTLDRDKAVIVYCRGGTRSQGAAEALRMAGFEASSMTEGIEGWTAAGLPLDPPDGYIAESGMAAAELERRQRAS